MAVISLVVASLVTPVEARLVASTTTAVLIRNWAAKYLSFCVWGTSWATSWVIGPLHYIAECSHGRARLLQEVPLVMRPHPKKKYCPGGATSRFWTPTTPPTNSRPEAPWGGGLGGGGFWEGHRGGRFPGGGGGSGTSEQLGMRPRCDPTVRTAPSHNRG